MHALLSTSANCKQRATANLDGTLGMPNTNNVFMGLNAPFTTYEALERKLLRAKFLLLNRATFCVFLIRWYAQASRNNVCVFLTRWYAQASRSNVYEQCCSMTTTSRVFARWRLRVVSASLFDGDFMSRFVGALLRFDGDYGLTVMGALAAGPRHGCTRGLVAAGRHRHRGRSLDVLAAWSYRGGTRVHCTSF